jgi:purine nucleoside permease
LAGFRARGGVVENKAKEDEAAFKTLEQGGRNGGVNSTSYYIVRTCVNFTV